MPTASQWENWRQVNEESIASATIKPDEAYAWIREVDSATCIKDLQDSGPFRLLDARLGTALSKLVTGDFAKQIALQKKQLSKDGHMLKGRQLWWLFAQHFKINEAEGQVKEFEDLLNLECRDNNLRAYVTNWEMTLTSIKNVHQSQVLSTFRQNIENHPWIKDQMSYYYRLDHGHADRSYEWLLSITRKTLANKRRQQTREELKPRDRRDSSNYAFAATQGICYSWVNKGKCAAGKNCPWLHDETKKGQRKGKGKGQDKRGRSTSRGRGSSANHDTQSDRSSSPGSDRSIDRQQKCYFFEKGTCRNGANCPYRHLQMCRYHAKGTCQKGEKCQFAHMKNGTAAPAAEIPTAPQKPDRGRSPARKEKKDRQTKVGRGRMHCDRDLR